MVRLRSVAASLPIAAGRPAVSAVLRLPRPLLVVVSCLLLLSACGFRLQGRVPLPSSLTSVWIDAADRQSDFFIDLQRALRASGAALAVRREDATAVLRIEQDQLAERVLTVSGRNLPREFELTYTVRLAVEGRGQTLLPAERFELSREQSFLEERLLAKEREQEVLRAALARDLVGVVMRRLSSLP